MFRVVETVLSKKLTLIDKAALCELAQTAMDLDYDGVDGDFLEAAGGGPGGAAVVIDRAKRRSRNFTAYGPPYEEIPGEGALALGHLDCGEYASMRLLLERLAPRLVRGGHLIIDDYKKEECKRAVDDYFHGKSGFRLERKSRLHVIRN